MGAARDVALNELNLRGISINPVAASGGSGAVTVVPSDSGIIFINKYVTGTTTYTLPAVADCAGKWFHFYNAQTSYALIIDLNTADTDVLIGNDITNGDSVTTAAETGETFWIVGDGSYFYVFENHGTINVAAE